MTEREEERGRFLRSLRRSRAAEFRSEIVPYLRYVAQSGFGLVASAALFALVIGYAQLLRHVPPAWPAGIAGAAAIWAAAVRAPLRTYLRAADPVFMLPMENAVLAGYIRPALELSVRLGMVRSLAVYLIYLPLYVRAPVTATAAAARPLWLLAVCMAALGAWNAYGGWRERQVVHRSRRVALRAARYVVTLAAASALLLGPPLPAFVFAVLVVGTLTLCWRLPQRQALPWLYLVEEEERTRRAWTRFLGWFVDVPSEEARPSRRRWAARLAELAAGRRPRAWNYLYAKTLARSDMLGSFVRWYAVIGLITLVTHHPLADWAACCAGFFVGGLQLTELGGYRVPPLLAALPVAPEGRRPAAAVVARWTGIAAVLVLWLWTAVPQGWPPSGWAAAALAAGLLWQGWIIPRRIARPRDEDED